MMPDKLLDEEETLYRQIHPNFMDGDVPSSQPFMPTPKDANKLSVDRSSMIDAAGSFDLFTSSGLASVAVYGVSIGEFREEKIDCCADPILDQPPLLDNPAHALADYSAYTTSCQKVKAKRLKQKALARGQMHP